MATLTSATRIALLARKTSLEASLEVAYETMDKLIAGTADKYRFDSGEGSQMVEKRALDKQIKAIDWLEARIDSIIQRLAGNGVVRMNVRRKLGHGLGSNGLRRN